MGALESDPPVFIREDLRPNHEINIILRAGPNPVGFVAIRPDGEVRLIVDSRDLKHQIESYMKR